MIRSYSIAAIMAVALSAGAADARGGRGQSLLRQCGPATCLVIDGRRIDPRAAVRIAGHAVVARGGRAFRVALPLDTVRAWSAPFARTILVSTQEPGGGTSEEIVRLPVGLLGLTIESGSIEIAAR